MTQSRGIFLYSAKDIVQCAIPEVVTASTDYLTRHNLRDDHLFCIAALKGKIECHYNRFLLTRRELNDFISNMSDDEDLKSIWHY
jgi:hypothetical protein